jgi:chromosome segregation ATPase
MKLDNFFSKSNKPKVNKARVISFVNEIQEKAWGDKVEGLEVELARLKNVDEERSLFNQRMQAAEIQLIETREREIVLLGNKELLENEVKQGDSLREGNQNLRNELRDLQGQLGLKETSLEQAAKNSSELNKHITDLEQKALENLQSEANLKKGLEDSIQNSAANKHEFQEMKTKFSDFEVELEVMTKDYSGLKIDHTKLSVMAEYWKRVSETLQVENDDLEQTSTLLKDLRKDVKVERTQQKGITQVRQNEAIILQGRLEAMTNTLEQLTYKNRHFLKVISSLRKEVAKPRYLSMGSIAQKEGFKMPFGNENIRKQFLGTSAPTLLKFRAKENEHDN